MRSISTNRMIRPVGARGTTRAKSSNWTPAILFSSGAKGFWYEARKSKLYKESPAVNPVSAVNDSVGTIIDLSQNGINGIQTTSGNRPIYKEDTNGIGYIEFDGVNDYIEIPSIGAGLKRTIWISGYLRTRPTSTAIIFELSQNYNNNPGSYLLDMEYGSKTDFTVAANKSSGVANTCFCALSERTSWFPSVLRIEFDFESTSNYQLQRRAFIDESELTLITISTNWELNANMQGIQFPNTNHYLGSRYSALYASQLNVYGILVINDIPNASTKAKADRYMRNLFLKDY